MLQASGTKISFRYSPLYGKQERLDGQMRAASPNTATYISTQVGGPEKAADQLTQARSHWSGMIAQIVLNSSVAETQQAAANQTGLSRRVRSVLERMLRGSGRHTDYAQVVVAERLYHLFGADPQWCLEWVFSAS